MRRFFNNWMCLVLIMVLMLSHTLTASAAEVTNPFELPDHIHIGGCEFICEESERNEHSTTLSIECGCGESLGSLNMCEEVQCNHNFETTYKGKTFESDVCNLCGFLRLHVAPSTMPFVTRKENVATHTEPYEDAPIIETIPNIETSLSVVARVRNVYNNVWLMLSDGSYVWAGNTAFDFDTALSYTLWYTFSAGGAEEEFTVIDWFGSMAIGFMPGGTFDYKLTNMLGSNTYKYYVLLNGEFQTERFTGETIGNINYGYAMAAAGFSKTQAAQVGNLGVTIASHPFELLSLENNLCYIGFTPMCDDANDLIALNRGWNYYNTGRWK